MFRSFTQPNRLAAFLALGALLSPSLGCNLLTGADDIEVDGGENAKKSKGGNGTGDSDNPEDGTPNGEVPGGPGGETGQPGVELVQAMGVYISSVEIYQGVRRPLMLNGSPTSSSVPVVAGRDALIRVFPTLDGNYNGLPVTARLTIEGQAPIDVVGTSVVSGNPNVAALESTINFQVPGSIIPIGGNYRIELLQSAEVSAGQNPSAVWPAEGFTPLNAQNTGAPLKVVIVPIQYQADGSNRVPDISATQIQKYSDGFYKLYPVAGVQVTVRATVGWGGTVTAGGSGWDNLLNAIADLRSNDGTPADTYYYGVFEPANSMQNYCSGGCVAGLGFIGGPTDSVTRAAIGLGFTGEGSVETAVHELGHNHGRQHAPCGGAQGTDQSFPHPGGSIGEWGYDVLTGALKNPNSFADLMGYCDPHWVSDYSFSALFTRIKAVNGAEFQFPPELMNRTWERLHLKADGSVEHIDDIELETPPIGEARTLTATTSQGDIEIEGRFIKYDHLDGGLLFYPKTTQPLSAIHLLHQGQIVTPAGL